MCLLKHFGQEDGDNDGIGDNCSTGNLYHVRYLLSQSKSVHSTNYCSEISLRVEDSFFKAGMSDLFSDLDDEFSLSMKPNKRFAYCGVREKTSNTLIQWWKLIEFVWWIS